MSNEREIELAKTVHGRVSQLIRYLQTSRCLLVLDNAETVLQRHSLQEALCNHCGESREGDKGYRELLKRVGEARHQSCLVLTSRKRPKEVGLLEGETLPVRVMKLKGLQVEDVREIFKTKGSFWGETAEWNRLTEYYSGNPLALTLVAKTIQKLFDGKIAEFLKHNTTVFGEIHHLLDQDFETLSETEKKIINWLAINRQPVSFSELREKILPPIPPQKLLEALESLEERALIEKKAAHFSVQSLVMEYFNQSESQLSGLGCSKGGR